MDAIIVYGIEHLSWGDDDKRTGHWFMRYTITLRNGKPDMIIARTRLARFEPYLAEEGNTTAISVVRDIQDAIRDGKFQFLPPEWTMKDVKVK